MFVNRLRCPVAMCVYHTHKERNHLMNEKKPRRSGTAGTPMYEMTVTLSGLPVWRKILVRGDMHLGLLHAVLQVAMGWTNSHLHQFFIGADNYAACYPDLDWDVDESVLDEEEALLVEVVPRARTRFAYEYDFGDSWVHDIKVDKIHKSDTAPLAVAECVDGAYACPPEDCGGIGGYIDLLEIIKDPTHEEHEEMMEWLGGEFDPEAFDIKKVNNYLKKLKFPRITELQLGKILMARDDFRG